MRLDDLFLWCLADPARPLGGAKPKALIDIGGEQWVIKFFNNEPVANASTAFRSAQPFALPPAGTEPQLGYPALARILRRVGVAQDGQNLRDAHELFRRMVFNMLMDNTDDHGKNHALLVVNPHSNGRLKLAPAYDVLPSNSGQGYQEFICGAHGRDSTLDNAVSECAAFGLTPAEAARSVADIQHLASFIDGDELLTQRRGFDPARHAARGAKAGRPPRKSPFSP